MGAVLSRLQASVSRGHSSGASLPVRSRVESTRPSAHINRWVTSSRDISIENTATGNPSRMPTCDAMLSASEVFPMPGRAARMIRLDGWKPAVILSMSLKPLGTPVMSLPCLCSSEIRSNEVCSSSWIELKSPVTRWLAMSNTTCSALSTASRGSPSRE